MEEYWVLSYSRLKRLRDKFPETLKAAQCFVLKMTQRLEERANNNETLNDIVIGKEITDDKRKKKVKKMAGELAEDDSVDSKDLFRNCGWGCSNYRKPLCAAQIALLVYGMFRPKNILILNH